MKIINLGLDKNIFDKHSAVAQRVLAYAENTEQYFILVPGKNVELDLSDKVKVKGIDKGNKISTLFAIYNFLKDKLAKEKYDIITSQDAYFLAKLAALLASEFKLKFEMQIHGLEKFSAFRKLLFQTNIKSADKIRVVSQRWKDKLINDFAVEERKIYVAPVAVDKEKILQAGVKFDLKEKYPNQFVFLTVGRLVKVKNIAMQLDALAKIDNASLVVLGEGPEMEILKKQAKDLQIEDRVDFVGWVDDLASYYKTADCLLLSSDSEGYGMVVAEAVLAGLPVIMTDVGCAGELVINNENGLVVPVGDKEAFYLAMAKVVEDRSLLQDFSVASQNFIGRILDRNELVNKVVSNWKELL